MSVRKEGIQFSLLLFIQRGEMMDQGKFIVKINQRGFLLPIKENIVI